VAVGINHLDGQPKVTRSVANRALHNLGDLRIFIIPSFLFQSNLFFISLLHALNERWEDFRDEPTVI
jgi:hypothetical protein